MAVMMDKVEADEEQILVKMVDAVEEEEDSHYKRRNIHPIRLLLGMDNCSVHTMTLHIHHTFRQDIQNRNLNIREHQ